MKKLKWKDFQSFFENQPQLHCLPKYFEPKITIYIKGDKIKQNKICK